MQPGRFWNGVIHSQLALAGKQAVASEAIDAAGSRVLAGFQAQEKLASR
jgi:hypothetical protein